MNEAMKALRERRGMTIEFLAEKAGIHVELVKAFEAGKIKPSPALARIVAYHLGANMVSDLFPVAMEVAEPAVQVQAQDGNGNPVAAGVAPAGTVTRRGPGRPPKNREPVTP